MKKFFSFVAVALMAISASADVLWSESLDRNGSYINKADFNNNWPYATQWFEAGNFAGSYTNVASYSCSVRNKKIDGAADNSIGFYFAANKTADQCYLTLEGTICTVTEGSLKFNICATEADGSDQIQKMVVEVNGDTATIPSVTMGAKNTSVAVEIPVVGAITSVKVSFNSISSQAFITALRIEGTGTPHDPGEGPVVTMDTITVARAMEIGNALENGATTTEKYCVIGYVAKLQKDGYNTEYGNQTVYMNDDPTATNGDFTAYRCKVAAPGVAQGDKVAVVGKIMKYYSEQYGATIEISQGDMEVISAAAFESVEDGAKATKVIENGQMVIIRNGVRFNAAGARL